MARWPSYRPLQGLQSLVGWIGALCSALPCSKTHVPLQTNAKAGTQNGTNTIDEGVYSAARQRGSRPAVRTLAGAAVAVAPHAVVGEGLESVEPLGPAHGRQEERAERGAVLSGDLARRQVQPLHSLAGPVGRCKTTFFKINRQILRKHSALNS